MSTGSGIKNMPAKVPPEAKDNPRCPRCQSSETKFCYYNNYNLSQPRYFCKSCRRYWTLGGSLRDIPTGGSSRKNASKRRRSSSSPVSHPPSSPTSPVSSTPVVLTNFPDATSTTTPTTDELSMADVEGTFKEILADPMPEGFDFDMGLGLGLGPVEEIGFDIGNTTTTSWSFLPDDRSAVVTGDLPLSVGVEDTWHAPGEGGGGGDGGNDGGSRFVWADLFISSPGKKLR